VLKVVAFGWFEFWADTWNRMDLFIVCISTVELASALLDSSFVQVFKVLRIQKLFKILRITRLVKMLKTLRGLRNLVYAVTKSLGAMAQVGALLFLIYFMYAYMGVLLFGTVQRGCAHATLRLAGT
jgi:hypothetical protein